MKNIIKIVVLTTASVAIQVIAGKIGKKLADTIGEVLK